MDDDDVGSNDNCSYLTSEEDHHQTTIYPKCSCGCAHCGEFQGYCPVRD